MTNEDIVKGKWKQMKGQIQQKWGKLTDDKLDQIEGNEEEVAGLIQEQYGLSREAAKDELRKMANKV